MSRQGEPESLRRGKAFHQLVQTDFAVNSKDGRVRCEALISLVEEAPRHGRADILITELGDFVTIVEIKATDWDAIRPENIQRNLWRHQRQLHSYVERYVDIERTDVCVGIIYPAPPSDPERRRVIETYLDEHGAPAYWYTEICSNPS